MENMIFALNTTVPIFLLMVLGFLFRKTGIFSSDLAEQLNKFVFLIALPILLFQDLATTDFSGIWNGTFVFFCFMATLLSILISFLLSFFLIRKTPSLQGEFVQASYRSSAAIFGIAFVQNIYGNSAMAPLMILGTVPLYNAAAVIVLSLMKADRQPLNHQLLFHTFLGILKNPIILGILAGCLWSVFSLPFPSVLAKTVDPVAGLATPLGLMAMGASFHPQKAASKLLPSIWCSFQKLILFTALFLPIAVSLGFRNSELAAVLIMLGSPTTVSCYVMARNMGHEGTLTANTVLITTLCSAFTLTGWLFLLKCFQLV